MTIWLVEQRDVYDNCIEARYIFSSEELADQFVEARQHLRNWVKFYTQDLVVDDEVNYGPANR